MRAYRPSRLLALVLVAGAALPIAAPLPSSAADRGALPFDFNGDGLQDVAVGTPWDRNGGDLGSDGAVHVFYTRNPDGPEPETQTLTMGSDGLGPFPGHPSLFGLVLESGDFNRDGYADLAITVPGYDVTEPVGVYGEYRAVNTGAVQVIYGSSRGLRAYAQERARVWTQDSDGVLGTSEDDDSFGDSLAAGDFDGDGYDDLAIGAPGERLNDIGSAGVLNILFGGAGGLTSTGDELWHQNVAGVRDVAEGGDVFGLSLAAGDLNGDGADDLAMGAVKEDVAGRRNTGAVNVLYGARTRGLTAADDEFLSQSSEAIPGEGEAWDLFGTSLTMGNFNGDGYDDLVIGAPWEKLSGVSQAGEAVVLYGGADGVRPARNELLNIRRISTVDSPPFGGEFAWAIAAGDVDRDGFDELAIGSPGFDKGDRDDAGRVDIVQGTATGLLDGTTETLFSGTPTEQVAAWRGFGSQLLFGRFDAVPGKDLVVAADTSFVRNSDGEGVRAAGAVQVLGSRDETFAEASRRVLSQQSPGIASQPYGYEYFGYSMPGAVSPNL